MKITSAAEQPTRRGGQASLGLFGIPGFDAPRQPLPRTPRSSRIKGALDSFSSDGLSAAHYRRPASAPVVVVPSISAPLRPRQDDLLDEHAVQMTPAMRAAARASDERERRRSPEDDAADFLCRCGGEDCVGITFNIQD